MPTPEWIGKDKVINHHQQTPDKVLEEKYTFGAEKSENDPLIGVKANERLSKELCAEFVQLASEMSMQKAAKLSVDLVNRQNSLQAGELFHE